MPQTPEPAAKTAAERAKAAVLRQFDSLLSDALAPGLYVVATPIGNLGDTSLRSLATLLQADHIYCEDTRISQRLLARFDITRKLSTYHEHNAADVRPEILELLAQGKRIALISDAGTPAISDPGFKLVRSAAAAGHAVIPIPGASAAIAALSAAGLATDRFLFVGFLPQKQAGRRKHLADLAAIDATLVFYESPHRLAATLGDMADRFPERSAVVARELTKRFEELKRGSLPELAAWAASAPVRGEVTIVIAPPEVPVDSAVDDEAIRDRLRQALAEMPPSRAAKVVADELGVSRARVYDLGLALKREAE